MNEEVNTVRLLSDQKPLVTSRWCWLGFHNWEKWGEAHSPRKNEKFIQNRSCADCNKIVIRQVEIPYLG